MNDRDIYSDGHGFRPFSPRDSQTMTKPPPQTHRVFVYGTLKRGYSNHGYLLREAHFAGEAVTPAGYAMLEPSFPVVMHAEQDGMAVAGELFHVNDATLAKMDRLEGVRPDGSGIYTREVIDVVEDSHNVKAYIYIGEPRYWLRAGQRIPSCTRTNERGELVWPSQERGR
jgi:gamma-glutamylaminecyclotransferase